MQSHAPCPSTSINSQKALVFSICIQLDPKIATDHHEIVLLVM